MSSPRWQCQYVNHFGKRCEEVATRRLLFHQEHPFDFVDVCEGHRSQYKFFVWEHELREDWNELHSSSRESR